MKQGLALLPFWDKADDWALAYITLARIHLAQANRADATEAVEKAVQFIETRGVFSEARQAAEIAQVKLWLAQGDLQAASHWAASRTERWGSGDRFRFENELAHITRARLSIALNRPKEALALLSMLEDRARSAGRMGRVLEILLLKALAMRATGDAEQALLTLTTCLALAEPEGYLRIFLDEGGPMQMLLARWLAHARPGPVRDHALRLLSHFDAEPQFTTAPQEKVRPAADPSTSYVVSHVEPSGQALVEPQVRPANDILVEPLSPREVEVLHLIAMGRTNREIAQQLIVALGTVKAHAASIYRKLDVSNRTEAVARARQLGILP